LKYTPRPISGNVNVSSTTPLRDFFTLATGITVTLVVIYVALGFALDILVPRLSPELENRIGRIIARSMEHAESAEPAEAYLQRLLDDLAARAEMGARDFRVHVVNETKVNAGALPGGHVVVFTGLLKEVESENELVMILGHELGHFRNRDHLRGFGRGLVLMAISVVLTGADSGVTQFLNSALFTTEMRFSRRQENAADMTGLELLTLRYGHAGGATDFFERMHDERALGRAGHFFDSHPYSKDRIRKLEERIRKENIPVKAVVPLDPVVTSAAP